MSGYKDRQTYNVPWHAHGLTFGTYRRLDLFSQPETCQSFFEYLGKARRKLQFDIWAYVVMPNHVHLLVWSRLEHYAVADILRAVKRPFATATLKRWERESPELLAELSVAGSKERRFWQPGGGYDRNLFTPKAIWNAIEYIHLNPCRKELVRDPLDWRWSSSRAYEGIDVGPLEVDICPISKCG